MAVEDKSGPDAEMIREPRMDMALIERLKVRMEDDVVQVFRRLVSLMILRGREIECCPKVQG